MHPDIEFLDQEHIRRFLKKNEHKDPEKLLLNPPGGIQGNQKLIAEQLISRKKAKSKLPTWYTNDLVIFPPPISMEQCSAERAASHKATLLSGDHLIDLTGGAGVDCLAFVKSFKKVTYVEPDPWLYTVFSHNARMMGTSVATVNMMAEDYLDTLDEGGYSFFIDPDRRSDTGRKVFDFSSSNPNIVKLVPKLMKLGQEILIKASPMMDITAAIDQLTQVNAVYVIANKNEVKEVLFHIKNTPSQDPLIHSIDLDVGYEPVFKFKRSTEKEIQLQYSAPGKYLYDPSAAILKSGAFKSIEQQFAISKIGPNTHLYSSDSVVPYFPGRVFEIVSVNPDPKAISAYQQMNVNTKNYPLSPSQLKKKYKLKEGGDSFLIGFRDHRNKPQLVICTKVALNEPRHT